MDSVSTLPVFLEVILPILFVPVCIVALVFPVLALKRMTGMMEEIEKGNRLLADIADGLAQIPQTSQPQPMVRAVPTAKVVPMARMLPLPGVISPPSVVPLQVSRDGEDLGLKDTTSIKIMLRNGELTLQDRYFNRERNEWVTLDRHPEISC